MKIDGFLFFMIIALSLFGGLIIGVCITSDVGFDRITSKSFCESMNLTYEPTNRCLNISDGVLIKKYNVGQANADSFYLWEYK